MMNLQTMMTVMLLSAVMAVSRTPLPLCDVSKGFAGEMNDKFTLRPDVEVNVQKNEALVIAVASVVAMGPVQATINATFELKGVVVSLMSDREGVLIIQESIPMGTDIQINVINLRPDGSTPFTIYSYVANKPTCFIGIESGRSFKGPVPTSINGAPASVYFVSQPASASTSFKFNVDGGVGCSVTFADSVSKIGSNSVSSLRGTDPQAWSTRGPVYIVVQPIVPSQPVWYMRSSISWSQPEVANVPKVTESDEPKTNAAPPAPKKGSSVFVTVLGLTVLGMVCYFVGRSVYNYRVLEIHEFPECVPHHVEIAGAATHAKEFFVSSKESFNTRRSAYSGVNGDDEDVA